MEGLTRLPCFGFRSEDGKRTCHEISGISNERAWRKRRGTLNRRERVARLGDSRISNTRRMRRLHRLGEKSSIVVT
jgi:hypothetical protein